jgi:GAF domain-containing protein
MALTLFNFVSVQKASRLLVIIDTAPLFLGLFAGFAGRRQDRIVYINTELGNEINARNALITELDELKQKLEIQVEERTKSLERRSHDIQAASDIGYAIVSIRDLSELLSTITLMINVRFGFYHVGIFLIDEDFEYAVLKSSNSTGGRIMLERGHRLRIGEEGIVGFVTKTLQPRIVLDVGRDAKYFDNPDLPSTRSELAFPLVVGNQLLGALDIQSEVEAAFTDEDVTVLQVLANQVSIAIHNTQLYEENIRAIHSSKNELAQLTGTAWRNMAGQSETRFVSAVDDTKVSKCAIGWNDDMILASKQKIIIKNNNSVVIPIILRDEVIGVIRMEKGEEDLEWVDEEIQLMDTLTDQLENAIESATLYRNSQLQASRDRMVTDITAKIRSTNDPQKMVQIAATELRQALQAQRTQVFVQEIIKEPNKEIKSIK